MRRRQEHIAMIAASLSRWVPWLLAMALGFTATLYWPGLTGPALLDDYSSVPVDWKAYIFSNTGPLGRPLSMLSFLANLYWSGNDLWIWKVTNLGIHVALGVVLFQISQALLATGSIPQARARILALFVAAIWLVHPLQVSTVLYTVQRMTQLSAFFTSVGISVYLAVRLRHADSVIARVGLWSVYLIFMPLAAFSKETGLLLPAYLAVLEFTVLREMRASGLRRHACGLLIWFLAIPCFSVACYFLTHFDQALWQPHLRRGFTLWERLFTECRILIQYLVQIVAPSRIRLGFFHDDVAVSTAFFSPPTTAISLFLLSAIFVAACRYAIRVPIVSCGVLWFFVGHSMESSIFPLELMFEHRNYLPSFGIWLAITDGFQRLGSSPSMRWAPSAAFAVMALFSIVTRSIVNDWRTEQSMTISFFEAHPDSERAILQMTELLMAHDKFEQARVMLAMHSGAGPRILSLYLECRQRRKIPDAMLDPTFLAHEKSLSPSAVVGLIKLSELGFDSSCVFSAISFRALLEEALKRPIVVVEYRHKLVVYAAHYTWRSHSYNEAFAKLGDALRLLPNDPMPAFLMSEWKLERGDIDEAKRALERGELIAKRSGRDFVGMVRTMHGLISSFRPTVER
jgi:protein O-mannosyl-transferase